MRIVAPGEFVTRKAWPRPTHGGPRYGTDDTYLLAAEWLGGCPTVGDWGGGFGYFGRFLPPTVQYTVVDGTRHQPDQVLADLATYTVPSDGILLRHVLDCAPDWSTVLRNALAACRERLCLVTFTPAAGGHSEVIKIKSGWPVWSFRPDDLRRALGNWLVHDIDVPTTHPEHVYYAERP